VVDPAAFAVVAAVPAVVVAAVPAVVVAAVPVVVDAASVGISAGAVSLPNFVVVTAVSVAPAAGASLVGNPLCN